MFEPNMNIEECFVLMAKFRAGRFWVARPDKYTTGEPASVRFDPDYIWENRKRLLGWWHTHPHWTAYPSSTDYQTMHAQVCSIGKPLLCVIEGTDGLRAWWFFDDESFAVEGSIWRRGNTYVGRMPKRTKNKVEKNTLVEDIR